MINTVNTNSLECVWFSQEHLWYDESLDYLYHKLDWFAPQVNFLFYSIQLVPRATRLDENSNSIGRVNLEKLGQILFLHSPPCEASCASSGCCSRDSAPLPNRNLPVGTCGELTASAKPSVRLGTKRVGVLGTILSSPSSNWPLWPCPNKDIKHISNQILLQSLPTVKPQRCEPIETRANTLKLGVFTSQKSFYKVKDTDRTRKLCPHKVITMRGLAVFQTSGIWSKLFWIYRNQLRCNQIY